ncbi:DNA-binding protein [Segetibacter sp. 3557_3]|uniref:helix-turn-helix domain-containing protein n=1 Tax=Segetibacter sp. 3557_3 TaxID=2547429 RepID=UPI001058596B|nr:helix-turn-helix domain-containing protein [Segetibacter sp. 3557_3]TDH18161.1 DNA-binding protein [Segetibacter sp. 3557_3]
MNTTKNDLSATPMLFPMDPEVFYKSIRTLIQEELGKLKIQGDHVKTKDGPTYQTPGLTYKPLYKITEVCSLFQVTRPTIYDWVKHGKLHPYKIRSRIYFLWNDTQKLLSVE